jgi:transcriptional regulator with XRE-family HTH domain
MSVSSHARLGALVRAKREAVSLSQQALADRAGVSRESVSRLENDSGEWSPRPRKLAQILLALDIGVPQVTDTVDDPALYVELVAEMDKQANVSFRNYAQGEALKVAHHKQGDGPADLILISPAGVTAIIEIKAPPRPTANIVKELQELLAPHGWIVSVPV